MVDRALLDKLAGIEAHFDELERMIADPANINDYEKVAEYAQERAELQPLVDLTRRYRQALDELEQAEALLDDPDMAGLAREEISRVEAALPDMEDRLRRMLLPKDPRDSKNVIVEIRAGAGGDEAGIFAGDLFRMYSRYAEDHRWKVEVLSAHETGVGGYKEIVFEVRGSGAFSRLKYESGVHRVQRRPVHAQQVRQQHGRVERFHPGDVRQRRARPGERPVDAIAHSYIPTACKRFASSRVASSSMNSSSLPSRIAGRLWLLMPMR